MQVGKGSAVATPSCFAQAAEQKELSSLVKGREADRARRAATYSQCCSASLAHACPTMFYIPLVRSKISGPRASASKLLPPYG